MPPLLEEDAQVIVTYVDVVPGAKLDTVTAVGVVNMTAPLPGIDAADVPYALVAVTAA